MALFGTKKNTKATKEAKPTKEVVSKAAPASANVRIDVLSVLSRPRVTEKASVTAENGVYVFEVTNDATKHQIAKAVEGTYKVVPTKVRIARIPSKRVFVRGKWGVKAGGKKAYVYLKKGDKIELM